MRIPDALKSRTNFEFHGFSDFLLNSTTDQRIPYALRLRRNCWQSSWPQANEMQDRVGNITVLSLTASRAKQHLKNYKQRDQDLVVRSDSASIEFGSTKFAYLSLRKNWTLLILFIIQLSRKVWRAGKDLHNFLIIEKQSSAEECNQLKNVFSVFCVLQGFCSAG